MTELAATEGAITPEDHEKIVASATDYIQSWIDGDAERMARCLHPDLVKRSNRKDSETGEWIVRTMTHADMVEATGQGLDEEDAGPYEISVLDAYGDTATVSLISASYVDYLHLARSGDGWLIVNVLWQRRLDR